MAKALNMLLDLIYPPKCVVCLEIIKMGEHKYLCENCIEKTSKLKGITVKYFNDKNVKNTKYIESGFAAFEYTDVKNAISHFKFKGIKNDGIYFAQIMYNVSERNFPYVLMDCDLIVPVPIHAKRYAERGFNQAEVLAENLGRLSGKEFSAHILVRNKNTLPQNSLDTEERLKNIKGAFDLVKGADVKGRKILLVDDIFTTGATLNECAKILKKNGAAEVGFYTLSAVLLK